jgi:hypothetical protein
MTATRNGSVAIISQTVNPTVWQRWVCFHFQVRKQQSKNSQEYWFEFVYLYVGICINLNEEIVNYNSMIISKWRPYDFRGAIIFGSI